jgi:hypothetical protein
MNKEKLSKRQSLPIGVDDFKEVQEKCFYIDKSLFIKEILEGGPIISLLLRPRRFGKTINMSMLKYFFEQSSTSYAYLFESLLINQYKESMEHQGKYPVIFLSLKDAQKLTWSACYESLKALCVDEIKRHNYLITSDKLIKEDKELAQQFLSGTATQTEYERFLLTLSRLLTQHHGQKTIILIDEYDAPVQQGYLSNYYDQVINFMRNFLGAGLKSNQSLEFGVLTGVLRVAKESLFSGLNNLKVVSFVQQAHSSMFGFTQSEVDHMLEVYGLTDKKDIVRSWYNGYRFGNSYVYNPWSILQFLDNKVVQQYWINAGNQELLQKLFEQHGMSFQVQFEGLLQNKAEVMVNISNTAITFSELDTNDQSIWLLLLFSGYMTIDRWEEGVEEQVNCYIRIPNQEVKRCLANIIEHWFKSVFGNQRYPLLFDALLKGDVDTFIIDFKEIVVERLSMFDIGRNEPEKTYHMFILGLLSAYGNKYEILSNREGGYGRYDIAMIPFVATLPSIIFEFKAIDAKEFEKGGQILLKQTADRALKQIETKVYLTNIKKRAKTVTKVGIACAGKHVHVSYSQE